MVENPGRNGSKAPAWWGILFEASLVGVAWILGWFLNQSPIASWRWDFEDTALGLLATLPMLVVFMVCLHLRAGPFEKIRRIFEDYLRPMFEPCGIVEFALISLAAGLGEEMLFRGVLQPVFARWMHPWIALGLASVLFGLMHPISFVYFLITTIFGIYFGWLMMARDNLLLVVVTHAVYDFLALVYYFRLRKS